MNYVFLDIETTGLDYKKDELIFIGCKKYDRNLKKLDDLNIYIKPKNEISKSTEKITGITNKELVNGCSLENTIRKLKVFLSDCYVICFNGEYDLSFLLTAMYQTKIDIKFWYLELSVLLREKLHFEDIKRLFKRYYIDFNSGLNKYIELTKKYMEENNVDNLDELVKIRPNKWNILFRGINYPEYLGDSEKYSFYMADLSSDKYPSYIFCLKEIRREQFTLEELKVLKNNYNIKILVSILDLDEEILKITNDYYIISYGTDINLNNKWGSDYIKNLNNAANFLSTLKTQVEITCYDSIKELEEKTKAIDKRTLDIIKSKIVREKKKWSRW